MATTTRVLTAAVSGTVYTTNANAALEAIDTCHAGTTAPTDELVEGKLWMDTTASPGTLKVYSASAWQPLGGASPSVFSIRDEKATNTAPQSLTASVWNIRDLQTTDVNTLTGASLAANVITLPEGTFDVEGLCKAYRSNSTKARLYDITNSATLVVSTVDGSHSSFYSGVDLHIIGRITVASGGITCRLEQIVQTASDGGVGAYAVAESSIYSYIKFTEVT